MARADGVHYWDVAGKHYLDALSRHLRRLGRARQPPRDRGDPASSSTDSPSRRRCTARTRSPCNWPTCWPSWRPGDLWRGEVPVRRIGSDRSGHQARAAVSQADRIAGQVQDHQPLPVVARLDAGLAVGLGAEVAQDGQRTDGPGLPARLPADLLSLPVRKGLPASLRHHLRHDRRAT